MLTSLRCRQSDFPYAPSAAYPGFLEDLEKFDMSPEQRDLVNFGNAQALIDRLSKQIVEHVSPPSEEQAEL